MRVYGLLHLSPHEYSAVNVKVKSFKDQLSIYIKNSIALKKSLQTQNIEFTLLTNNKAAIDEQIISSQMILDVVEIPFITDVPPGVRFFSAHFKVDVFRYFSTLSEKYVGLFDLDMICVNKIPSGLKNIIESSTPIFYDISDQVIPVFGQDVIVKDLSLLTGLKSEGRWSGGEMIAGPPTFFAQLVKVIDSIWPTYANNVHKLHHVGDEAVVSAALEIMRTNGHYMGDAGSLGIVGRFWSGAVQHSQRNFSYFKKCFVLHLPSDKRFLSKIKEDVLFNPKKFLRLYYWHLIKMQPRRFFGNLSILYRNRKKLL